MTAGRPPKPSALHLVNGTKPAAGSRAHEAEPTLLTADQALQPPEHLEPASAEVWRRLAPRLQRARLLTELDLEELEILCDSYADYRLARSQRGGDITTVSPKGNEALSQTAVAAQMFRKAVREGLAAFGMNPSARTRAMTGQAQPGLFDQQAATSGPLRHFR